MVVELLDGSENALERDRRGTKSQETHVCNHMCNSIKAPFGIIADENKADGKAPV